MSDEKRVEDAAGLALKALTYATFPYSEGGTRAQLVVQAQLRATRDQAAEIAQLRERVKQLLACVATANHDLVSLRASHHASESLRARLTSELAAERERAGKLHEALRGLAIESDIGDQQACCICGLRWRTGSASEAHGVDCLCAPSASREGA